MPTDCPSEDTKQSQFSPSRVSNKEILLYVLIEPHNYAQNGLIPRAFSRSELTSSDVSVSRRTHTSRTVLQNNVIDILLSKDQRRNFVGILKAKCGKLRALKTREHKNKRALCVVDDGTRENIGHAQLGFSETAKHQQKNFKTAYRANLISLFGDPYSIDDIYL